MTALSIKAQQELLDLCFPEARPVEVKALSPELQEHALSLFKRTAKPRKPQPVRTTLWCGCVNTAVLNTKDAMGEPISVCSICKGG